MPPDRKRSFDDPEFHAGDRIRTEIGEFEVQQVVGTGGMGVVYQVVREQKQGGRQHALKTILPELLNRREVVDRFDHENIVKIDGIFTMFSEPPRPFILMELLHGYTLRYVMDQYDEPLPVNDVCTVAIGVCNALEEIHKHGVVHRDIKPENIFIQKRRKHTRVVLIDFGIMKLVLGGAGNQTAKLFLGSYSNASPEQLLAKEVTPRSDFYSLGTVLYELLTGGPLFPDVSESHAIGLAHVSRRPIPLHERAPQVPKEIADIVMRALDKDPNARPKDAHAFRQSFTTVRNRLLRDQAQSAGHSTIERFLANTVGAERVPPVPSMDFGGLPLVAARPAFRDTTDVSSVQHGGTQPDRPMAPSERIVPPGVTRPEGGARLANEKSPTSPADDVPAPSRLSGIPIQPLAELPSGPGTDPTSSRDVGARAVAAIRPVTQGEESVVLPLQRPLLPRVLSVIAVGAALLVGSIYVRRSVVNAPGHSTETVQAQQIPSDPAPSAPTPLASASAPLAVATAAAQTSASSAAVVTPTVDAAGASEPSAPALHVHHSHAPRPNASTKTPSDMTGLFEDIPARPVPSASAGPERRPGTDF
jgi:serine/threonine protein kinase